jgi:hypothetical protein
VHLQPARDRIRGMPPLQRILAAFRAGQLDQAGLLTRVQALAKEPQADIARLIEVLQAEHRKAPLPAAAFAAVLRSGSAAIATTMRRFRAKPRSPTCCGERSRLSASATRCRTR